MRNSEFLSGEVVQVSICNTELGYGSWVIGLWAVPPGSAISGRVGWLVGNGWIPCIKGDEVAWEGFPVIFGVFSRGPYKSTRIRGNACKLWLFVATNRHESKV